MLKYYAAAEEPSIFEAYKKAGYQGRGTSGGVSAQQIFYSPNFQKALQEELDLRDKLFRVDAGMVLRNLERMANANLKDYGSWSSEGFVLKSSEELTRDRSYAIAEIKQNIKGEVSIKLESRIRANELLATHFGMLIPDQSRLKSTEEAAQSIKTAYDALNGSVPTEPPVDLEAEGAQE
jgi:phage terminase small subunit